MGPISKIAQHPSKIKTACEHTTIEKCLSDTMDCRAGKKNLDKQLVNFFGCKKVTYTQSMTVC